EKLLSELFRGVAGKNIAARHAHAHHFVAPLYSHNGMPLSIETWGRVTQHVAPGFFQVCALGFRAIGEKMFQFALVGSPVLGPKVWFKIPLSAENQPRVPRRIKIPRSSPHITGH